MALGAGYRVTDDVMIGAAFHYYLGSSRLTSQRVFCDSIRTLGPPAECGVPNLLYAQVGEQSITDYHGIGGAVGIIVTRGRVDLAASGRLNGRLRSGNSGGQTAMTQLPAQLNVGVRVAAVPGIYLSGAAAYAGWGAANSSLLAAGKDGARDTWAVGAGAEVLSTSIFKVRMPLRLGYRWRQLPFLSLGQGINEWAASGGLGFSLAHDRTTLDFAYEHGRRTAGAERETFSTLFAGLTVRP